jgi:predicted transcriptional regulator of viral defense system
MRPTETALFVVLSLGQEADKNLMRNRAEQQRDGQRTTDFMELNRVFTVEEFARHLGGQKSLAEYRVRYYLRQRRLKRLANGVYATVPIGVDPESYEPDAFLAAVAIRPDAVFAYHSALDLLGQGHSIWWTCTVCTARRRSPVILGRSTVKFLSHPSAARPRARARSLRGKGSALWTTEVSRGGRTLRVTTPERTLVDGFRELSLVGGLDELVESMGGFATLQPEALKEILRAYENRRLWAAVGWYLQRRLKSLFLDAAILKDFQKNRPRTRVYLVPGQRGGVLARDWNLVVPEHLQRGGRSVADDDGDDAPGAGAATASRAAADGDSGDDDGA